MANRYWVGGTNTWDATAGTKWSTTSGGSGGASVPTSADSVFFDQAGTYTVTISGTRNCLDITVSAGTVTFTSTGALTVAGSMSLVSTTVWNATGTITFTGSPTVTTNTVTIGAPITYNSTSGTMTLGSALTLANTRTFTLTAGTLNLVSYTLTTGLFSSSNSNTRVIAFGTGNITVNGATGTLWTTSTVTNLTTTGTQVVNVSNSTAGNTTITSGSLSEANSISFNFTTGSYALTLTAGTKRNLNFTGFGAGTVSNTAQTIYGNMILSNDMTLTGGANIWTLGGTVVSTRDVDLANKTALGFPLTFNATGSTFRFLRNTTLNTNYTWQTGNFDLNGFELSVTTFVRTPGFGAVSMTANGGRVNVTGTSGVVLDPQPSASYYISGVVPIYLTPTSTPSGRTISSLGQGFSLYFSGAVSQTDTLSITPTNFYVKNLDSTGFSGTFNATGLYWEVYGSLFFNSSTSFSGFSSKVLYLWGSGVQETIGGTTSFPTFGTVSTLGSNSNYKLNQNVTTTDSFGVGNGTLDLNGKTVTTKRGSSSGTIAMSGGTIVLTGSNSDPPSIQPVWNTTDPATFTGSGTISCTSNLDKYIGPAGRTLPTINQGGTGTLSLEDDGTGTGYVLNDLTSTATSNTTIVLPVNVTTTFTNFTLSGASTAQVTLRSGGSGTRATISKASGTVSVSYLTIQDIAATGGATWNAFTTNGNVDGGNNTGWNFSGATTQTLLPSLVTNTNVFYLTTITPTGPPLLPDLYVNTNVFYTPTVSAAYTLAPALYVNPNTFYAPTVSAAYTLAPALYVNTNVFYSPTVTVGAVDLAPALYTNTNTFYTPTVSAAYTLAPALYANTNVFYAPTVSATYTLAPALYANTNVFYSATITQTGGTQTLLPNLYVNTNVFYSPTVTPGAVNLAPARYVNPNVFYAATVTPGAVDLAPALYTNTNVFYSPTVSTGVILAPELFVNTNVFYTPALVYPQIVYPDLFVNANIFYAAFCYLYPFHPNDVRPGSPSAASGPRQDLPPAPNAARQNIPLSSSGRQPMPAAPNAGRQNLPLSSSARQPMPFD